MHDGSAEDHGPPRPRLTHSEKLQMWIGLVCLASLLGPCVGYK